MATKMLIDATHAEETRVAVVDNQLLEEFDFETSTKQQNKGNIYLAKVTRVEPSLQAAFVDYGGNRQGFLAFNEIHPDYYQIPIDDRKEPVKDGIRPSDPGSDTPQSVENDDEAADKPPILPYSEVSGEQESGEKRKAPPVRHYRIQEVIKRRQILLVQVNKEERGTKGAALTTYISLPGRYCVLMPNTSRGGGVSRKIESLEARKRLREMVNELNVPEGMAVIVRTAGQERNKSEIKRDFEYLIRLWETIRDSTLKSIAPELVYEEANLIKRSIRDLYRPNFDGILVQGEEGYRTAKSFMRMMMPSRAKLVQPYREEVSLFHQYQIEDQLDRMHHPAVTLPSGGYLVINVTEALVAIDVNSGSATRERSIEETALKTNLEAATAIARQLRLRDLAGLVVIDFIDMDEPRNNRTVERELKDAFSSDRARLQIGRISSFGLLELSRQRLRPSLLEATSRTCPHCLGNGRVRSSESLVMQALRAIEQEGLNGSKGKLTVGVPTDAAMYLLNNKRHDLHSLESKYGMEVLVVDEKVAGLTDVKVTLSVGSETPLSADKSTNNGRAESDNVSPIRPHRSGRRPASVEAPELATQQKAAVNGVGQIEGQESATADQTVDADGKNVVRGRPRRRGRRGGRRRSSSKTRELESVAMENKTDKENVSKTFIESEQSSNEVKGMSGNGLDEQELAESPKDTDNDQSDEQAIKVNIASEKETPRPRRRSQQTRKRKRTKSNVSEPSSAVSDQREALVEDNVNGAQSVEADTSTTGNSSAKAEEKPSGRRPRRRSGTSRGRGSSKSQKSGPGTSNEKRSLDTDNNSAQDDRSIKENSSTSPVEKQKTRKGSTQVGKRKKAIGDSGKAEKPMSSADATSPIVVDSTISNMKNTETRAVPDSLPNKNPRKGWWQRIVG